MEFSLTSDSDASETNALNTRPRPGQSPKPNSSSENQWCMTLIHDSGGRRRVLFSRVVSSGIHPRCGAAVFCDSLLVGVLQIAFRMKGNSAAV